MSAGKNDAGAPNNRMFSSLGSKGWRRGESARLPSMWPGFKSRRRRHMWVEFVVGSLLCSERFSPLLKNRFDQADQVNKEPLCGCATSKSLFIYIYLFLLK